MKLNKKWMFAGAMASALIMSACSGCDDPVEPEADIARVLVTAWGEMETGDYASAKVTFSEALDIKLGSIEANLGYGWAYLLMDEGGIDDVLSHLSLAINDAEWGIHAKSGRAIAYFVNKEYALAIIDAQDVLSNESMYRFTKITGFDYWDLKLLIAESYYFQSDYNAALLIVNEIAPEFLLDPNIESSWVIDGQEFPSFPSALADVLRILSERYR